MLIPIYCRTILDIKDTEKFPEFLPFVPRIGDKIKSGHTWREDRSPLVLEVVDVTICKLNDFVKKHDANYDGQDWYAEVELHLPKGMYLNIAHFYSRYDCLCGEIDDETCDEQCQKILEGATGADIF